MLLVSGVFALLAGAFVLGPRPEVDTTRRPLSLPNDLDAYLARTEARFNDVRPGAEKTIVWADSLGSRTEVAVVYLHGFSATRQETRPLADSVAAQLGANLFYTRLAGHGRSDDAMAEASVNAWLNDAYEAVAVGRRLGEKILLIGTSTGATLATWLAAQPDIADTLLALVLISPNFAPKDPNARFLLWPWGGLLAEMVSGPYREWEPHNADQGRYWTTRYPTEALLPMMGLVGLVDELDLGVIQTPVLVLYSPKDQVIDETRVEARFDDFGATRKKLFTIEEAGDPSNHVLAGAVLSPENTVPLTEEIVRFVR